MKKNGNVSIIPNPVIIKTNDENYWFELTCDDYNWMVTECNKGMHKFPRTGEIKESVSRTTSYPSNLAYCFKHVYSLMLKNQIDGQDIIQYLKDIKAVQKELFNVFAQADADFYAVKKKFVD